MTAQTSPPLNYSMIEPQADSTQPMPYQSLNHIAPPQLPNSLPLKLSTNGQATQQQDPLAQLRDIHIPNNSIHDYPIALGWWIVLLLVLSTLTANVVWWRKHKRDNRYRQQALTVLSGINVVNPDSQKFTQQVNTLLKQCAKAAYPHHECLSLHGERWIEFLQTSAPKIDIDPELTTFVIESSYQPISKPEMHQATYDFAVQWLKHHVKLSKLAQVNS